MHAQEMSSTHPQARARDYPERSRCVEACYDCAQACTACADACLGESAADALARCITACLNCADVCAATGKLATRQTHGEQMLLVELAQVCETACRLCAEECETHAEHMAHCRICAEACRACEAACRQVCAALEPPLH